MSIVPPAEARHSTQDDGINLRITIPSRKSDFAIIFLPIWLIGWACGELMVGGILFANFMGIKSSEIAAFSGADYVAEGNLFMLAWFIFWTIGGGSALYNFLWQLVGKENIEIGNDSIKIQRALFGIGRVKEYLSTHVKDLRVSPLSADNNIFGMSRETQSWGTTGGFLAFDYGAQTLRFGGSADEAESKQILEKIVSRFPQYRV